MVFDIFRHSNILQGLVYTDFLHMKMQKEEYICKVVSGQKERSFARGDSLPITMNSVISNTIEY